MATPSFDSQDVQQNKVLGGLGYLVFFIPMLACPSSKFGRFAANQGLIGLVLMIAVWLVSMILGWIPLIGWLVSIAAYLANLLIGLLMLYYTFKAVAQGEAKAFPVVGGIQLIK